MRPPTISPTIKTPEMVGASITLKLDLDLPPPVSDVDVGLVGTVAVLLSCAEVVTGSPSSTLLEQSVISTGKRVL